MSEVRLSSRAVEMPASPIRRLVPYADRARARGIKVYHLNIGQPDIETPAEMMGGYRRVNVRVLSHGPPQGLKDYVDALVRYYGRVRIKMQPAGETVDCLARVKLAEANGPVDEVLVPRGCHVGVVGPVTTREVEKAVRRLGEDDKLRQ